MTRQEFEAIEKVQAAIRTMKQLHGDGWPERRRLIKATAKAQAEKLKVTEGDLFLASAKRANSDGQAMVAIELVAAFFDSEEEGPGPDTRKFAH